MTFTMDRWDQWVCSACKTPVFSAHQVADPEKGVHECPVVVERKRLTTIIREEVLKAKASAGDEMAFDMYGHKADIAAVFLRIADRIEKE